MGRYFSVLVNHFVEYINIDSEVRLIIGYDTYSQLPDKNWPMDGEGVLVPKWSWTELI